MRSVTVAVPSAPVVALSVAVRPSRHFTATQKLAPLTARTLPGPTRVFTQGRTRREALKNMKEAIEVYVAFVLEDGLPVPAGW